MHVYAWQGRGILGAPPAAVKRKRIPPPTPPTPHLTPIILYSRGVCLRDLQEKRDGIYGVSAANADLRFGRRAPRLPTEHYCITLQILPGPLLCCLPKPLGPLCAKPPKPWKTLILLTLQFPPAVRHRCGAPQLPRTARAQKRAADASGGGPAPKSHGGTTKKGGTASAEKKEHHPKFPRTIENRENYTKSMKITLNHENSIETQKLTRQ